MANNNKNLSIASKKKQDEFYTQLTDIEKELSHYKEHFKDKVVFCNCDDPFESNFFKYFVLNFNNLGLKKLIATCYTGSPIEGEQLSLFDFIDGDNKKENTPYKAIVTKVYDKTGDGGIGLEDIKALFKSGENTLSELKEDGDFRSKECLDLLDEADIVCTNPPFSLFREYIATLMDHKKKFLIIGNQNAMTYKEIFPLIENNKLWLGYHSGHTWFSVPDNYEIPDYYNKKDKQKLRSNGYKIDENGKLWRKFGNICWMTNLDIKKRDDQITLFQHYNSEDYPKYENYDAIEVSKVVNIPVDFNGFMGVPISFLNKFSPDQFDIIGLAAGNTRASASKSFLKKVNYRENKNDRGGCGVINGKRVYARIIIKNKHPED